MEKLKIIEKKILTNQTLDTYLALLRFKEKKIVFTNGCFDILHKGHVDYLAKARDFGDILIVGLNTDSSVRRLKGTTRPINDESGRILLLASLLFVDAVILFDEDTPYNLISKIQPDVLIKGQDYKPESIVGYDIVMEKGGEVLTLDYLEGYSTSAIEKRMKESN